MTRDFNKDLTIMVTGTGNISKPVLAQYVGDWIFPSPDFEREVHIILPLFAQMGGGMRNLIDLGMEWAFKFTVLQVKDAPMTRALAGLPEESFVHLDSEREALEWGINFLKQCSDEDETAFLMAYNPKSTYEQGNSSLSDYEIIGDVKTHEDILTLNLCEALIDSFEGYKSLEETEKEERLQKEFNAKQKAENPVAEKPSVPRKRAARKVVAPKVTLPLEEPEKAPESLPVGTVVEVAGLEFTKVGPNPFREPLPMDAVLSANIILPKKPDPMRSEWAKDIIKHQSLSQCSDEDLKELVASGLYTQEQLDKELAESKLRVSVLVRKDDLSDLSAGIKELTESFGKIMDTFTRILKEN
jgi:hypothetical protein